MTVERYRAGAAVCLGLGLANLAWINVSFVPRLLEEREAAVRPETAEAPVVAEAKLPSAADEPRAEQTARAEAPIARAEPTPVEPTPAAPEPSRSPDAAPEATPPPAEPIPAEAASARRVEAEREARAEPQRAEIRFVYGSDRLNARAKRTLRRVAAADTDRYLLVGYTDPAGSDRFNRRLSERRAQAVKQYLLRRGVKRGRIELRAEGEAVPDGVAPANHAARRRVDVFWKENP